MTVGLENHIRIVPFSKGMQLFVDHRRITFIEQTGISVVGVDDRPVVGVRNVLPPKPNEAFELLPVARHCFGSDFDGKFSELHGLQANLI